MTTEPPTSLNLHVGKGRAWKDLLEVAFLVVLLGAFVAQISSTPKHTPGSGPATATAATALTHG